MLRQTYLPGRPESLESPAKNDMYGDYEATIAEGNYALMLVNAETPEIADAHREAMGIAMERAVLRAFDGVPGRGSATDEDEHDETFGDLTAILQPVFVEPETAVLALRAALRALDLSRVALERDDPKIKAEASQLIMAALADVGAALITVEEPSL